jgi:hypothetical protein
MHGERVVLGLWVVAHEISEPRQIRIGDERQSCRSTDTQRDDPNPGMSPSSDVSTLH